MVYLNKVYEKYITLVGNSAILNPMNKYDKLLVLDAKVLISGGSSINSNDFNPDEDNLWFVFPSCTRSNVGYLLYYYYYYFYRERIE